MGRLVAPAILRHPELELVAAVDPACAGEPLGALVPGAPDLVVQARAGEAYRRHRGGVAVLCGGSRLDEIERDLLEAVRAGFNVVSTCEELVHAPFVDPELAEAIDREAERREVAVLGTGIHPGFIFDRLVSTVAGVVGEIRHVEGGRVIDLEGRARGWSALAGIGRSEASFEEGVEEGRVGQPGLSESCALLADGLGLEIDEVEEAIDPILAPSTLQIGDLRIDPGTVCGLQQVARGFEEGREVVRLSVRMAYQPVEPRDWVRIDGSPPVELVLPGGLRDEEALGWAVAHAIPRVMASDPGLLSVLDLPAGR